MNKDKEQLIEEVLTRGVEMVYPTTDALRDVLRSGKKLRIYNGIDPTGQLHIGHGVVLEKLRQLQNLGHEIIVLIGDFTATIGDPTDKLATRQPLTRKQVLANAKNYKKIIGKILDTKRSNVRFLHNEKWTNKLKPFDMLDIASHFTVARLLERDMFQARLKAGKDIHVHEFLYPIFQAYDSVSMDVDMEVGGNDQTFNMLAGRTLMRKMKGKEKFVLTMKLLVDPNGKKMGKTEGNMVNLEDSPSEIYGKVMSWTDGMIVPAFEIATRVPMEKIVEIKKDLAGGVNPKTLKMLLAYTLVELYHGTKAADIAQEQFGQVFSEGQKPADIEIKKVKSSVITEILVETGLASSLSEARRLIEQGGIKIDDQKVTDTSATVAKGSIIQKGKRYFIKVS